MTTKQTKSLTIIKRSSPSCPMYEMLTRGLDDIGAEYTAIDIAENPEVVSEYSVSTIPRNANQGRVERRRGAF